MSRESNLHVVVSTVHHGDVVVVDVVSELSGIAVINLRSQ